MSGVKLFIGMESSGTPCRSAALAGFDVISCDMLPQDDAPGFGLHIVGDVYRTLELLRACGWVPDFALFHITCTYLTRAAEWAFKDPDFTRYPGVGYHQRLKPGTLFGADRRAARVRSLVEFCTIRRMPFPKVVENPRGALTYIAKPAQAVQPYQFGHDASKETCFWAFDAAGDPIQNFRLIADPAKRVPGRIANGREVWANQTDNGQNNLAQGSERWKLRSKTYSGISEALVEAVSRNSRYNWP